MTAVVSAAIHVVIGRIHHRGVQRREPIDDLELLDRNDAIAAQRQNRAGHHLDCVIAADELQLRRPGCLHSPNAEPLDTAPQRLAVDRHAIHGDAIEGRLIALRIDVLPQSAADALRQRQ